MKKVNWDVNSILKGYFNKTGGYNWVELDRKKLILTVGGLKVPPQVNKTFQCEVVEIKYLNQWEEFLANKITHLQQSYDKQLEGNKI